MRIVLMDLDVVDLKICVCDEVEPFVCIDENEN